ncbi:MAG: CBS domain-containing protein [Bacteroidota bacterium]|nr:CBS domain-containing protein [Bacteroidota bacterium]MDQ6889789.1 CBS domain-containing protein [Bacteroidota bacterium]
MLAYELTNNLIPQLKLSDTVSKALQLMSDFKVTHLPVVSEELFLGLISEDDLQDEDNKKTPIEFFQNDFICAFINSNDHFLNAVTICSRYQTNVIPVINDENELVGTIAGQVLLSALGDYAGANESGAMLEFQMERSHFNIAEINRIVESDGAVILHLNSTSIPDTTLLKVSIHINKKEISTLIAAFERYEYSITYYSGEELFENDIDTNYRHLMNYLDI